MSNIKNKHPKIYTPKVVTFSAIFMCALAAIFYCYEYYLRVAPTVITADLMRAFKINNTSFGSFIAYYYFAYVPAQIPAGVLLDRYGPRIILTISSLICAIGTLFFISDHFWLAKVGRFIVGFGSAFAYVGVLKIASIWLPKKYFALVAGITSALGMFGGITGIILVERLVRIFGWRDTLFYAGIAGIILSFFILFFIKARPKPRKGQVSMELHKTSFQEMFLEIQNIIKIPAIWCAGLIGCFSFLPLSIFAELWATPFLEAYGLSPSNAAIGASLVFVGFAIGGPLCGLLSEKLHTRKKIIIAGLLLSSIASLIIVWWTCSNLWILYTLLFSLGFFASAEVLVFAIGNDVCDPKVSGTTVAFINMLVMCGGIVLQPTVGFILDYFTLDIHVGYVDYQQALLVLPFGIFIGLIISLYIKETFNKTNT